MKKIFIFIAVFISLCFIGFILPGRDAIAGRDPASQGSIPQAEPEATHEDRKYWTPGKFRLHHPVECEVVDKAIWIRQAGGGETDFPAIDALVDSYINRKGIRLPSDAKQRIAAIAAVCSEKFDISGYDESNFGANIADGTRRLFADYIGWLYEQEARRICPKEIALGKDLELMEALCRAMCDVSDTVAGRFEGSGGWSAASDISDIEISYRHDLCKAIVGADIEKRKTMDVAFGVFDKECDLLAAGYEPMPETQPIDPKPIADRYKKAFHKWYLYRKATASRLTGAALRKQYDAITYGYARLHLLHLKNRFNDIGMMDGFTYEVILKEDCSNQELLEYSYEESRQRHLQD